MISILTYLLIIPFCSYQVSYMKRLNLCSFFSPDHYPPLFIFTHHLGVEVTGFPGGTVVKNLPASAGGARDMGSIPGLWRSLGGGNCNPLQYSFLENSMDRGAWQAVVHGVPESRTQLSAHTQWTHQHLLSTCCVRGIWEHWSGWELTSLVLLPCVWEDFAQQLSHSSSGFGPESDCFIF